MRFDDFLVFDAAAQSLYDDPSSQHRFRACLTRLAETARRFPGTFLAEAAKKDSRKGVAFRQKSLDEPETGVFASRLADRLWAKPDTKGKTATKPDQQTSPAYGEYLRHSVRQQGNVLGKMKWDDWAVTKTILGLGGMNPKDIGDPPRSPAEFHALIGKINWANVTLPALKAKLGPAFTVPADWKRQYAVERLKKIKAAVEAGQPITDPHEQKLLQIWRTLEVQLGSGEGQPSQILPAGPRNDVGMTKLPMSQQTVQGSTRP